MKRTDYIEFLLHELQRTARAAGPAFRELYHAASIKECPAWLTEATLESLIEALDELGGDDYD